MYKHFFQFRNRLVVFFIIQIKSSGLIYLFNQYEKIMGKISIFYFTKSSVECNQIKQIQFSKIEKEIQVLFCVVVVVF